MRIFCHTHKRSFLAEATTPLICEKGQHVLGAAPGDKGSRDYWEYCCSCQNFWRFDPDDTATAQCPVCERAISVRFLCSNCDTLCVDSLTPTKIRDFYLSLNGAPVPGCPACLATPDSVLEHVCEALLTTFSTSREVCPFCDDKIAPAPSFPASVVSFLTQYDGDRVEVSFDTESRQLVKATPGDFVLIRAQKASSAQIVLPNRTEFNSHSEFLSYYKDYYDCDGPFNGEVFVVHPATVRKEGKGWSLLEVGRLRVEPREIRKADDGPGESAVSFDEWQAAQEPSRICPQCGLTARSHHKFCKKCGTQIESDPLWADDGDDDGDEEIFAGASPAASHKGRWLLVVFAAFVLLGGLIALSFAIARNSTEARLKDAIARGNLIAPPNESAYDYYTKLQREGASPATLATYRNDLLTRLVQRPQALLDEVILPRGSDGSVAEWEESQKLLAWAIELSPQDKKLAAKGAYCEGRVAYLKNRPDDAIAAYQRASKLDTQWATPLNSVGALLNERRRYSESRPYLFEAIRLNPNWALPYNNLGTSFFFENRNYEAQVNYEKAKALAPTWARPHAWLGSLALKQKDYCNAASELDQALQLATPNMVNWNSQRIQRDLESARAACAAIPEQ